MTKEGNKVRHRRMEEEERRGWERENIDKEKEGLAIKRRIGKQTTGTRERNIKKREQQ